jgi:hypothetical protein
MKTKIVNIVCPKCGSNNVTCDATARWSVEAQAWDELSSSQDQKTCEACGYSSDDFKEVELDAEAETSDVGGLIAELLNGHMADGLPVYGKPRHGGDLGGERFYVAKISAIDDRDLDNLVIEIEDGKRFTVRVVAG